MTIHEKDSLTEARYMLPRCYVTRSGVVLSSVGAGRRGHRPRLDPVQVRA